MFFVVAQKSVSCSPLERKTYAGYKVLKINPQNEKDVQFLRQLMLSDDSLHFGSRPSVPGRSVDLMVSPEQLNDVNELLQLSGIPHTVKIHDVEHSLKSLWEEIDSKPTNQERAEKVLELNKFNTLDEIVVWMTQLTSQCRSGLTCQLVSLGNSFQARPIYAFRITKEGENRKGFYIDATSHSSDWISTSTAINVLNALAKGVNEDAIRLTDNFDWHIVPVVNPDGYEYTWKSDRYWKKNRRPQGACYGTDLNLNFEYMWGNEAASHSPCNNQFCGVGPASEPETQVIQAELRRGAATLRGVFSFHAVGNTWEFPWGYTVNHAGDQCFTTSDHSRMLSVAAVAAAAAGSATDSSWRHGGVCETSGATSGGVYDFAKATAGITYSFYVGLRGDSFVIDPTEIVPAYLEAWTGLVATVEEIA